jgi:hypothetical protein
MYTVGAICADYDVAPLVEHEAPVIEPVGGGVVSRPDGGGSQDFDRLGFSALVGQPSHCLGRRRSLTRLALPMERSSELAG